ncbi:MAG: hypothetical protein ACOVQG_04175 [Crocinitomicaceae bacterium]
MLNSDYIHLKIKAPETCSSEDTGNFKELIELYPYASTFSILYLKSLSNSGDIRLENELEKFAFRINDRSVLYKLIHSQQSQPISEEEIVEEISLEEKTAETSIETAKKLEEEEIKVTSEPIKSDSEEIAEVQENEKVEKVEEQDELDKLINSAAIASSFVERELESLPEIKQEAEIIQNVEEEEKTETIEEKNPIEEKSIESDSPKSFTDWLKASSNSIQEEIEEGEEEEERKPEYYTFEKPKKEFFSPTKKAKESLDENKMPVSETLAKIFALQGNFSKAIYVYEQLILIFPEKKPFFATQIKNLKKKLNP